MHLSEIRSPDDLKRCNHNDLSIIACEIREKIINTVSQNGGHLASNLGIVEVTLALHRAFDSPKDAIIFDVGHQCYAHKILTGRGEQFCTLRTYKGISGFPRNEESPCDAYNTGHASTAISAALGMARARDIQGGSNHVVAVVGDGALTGGMCYEALNDAGSSKTRLIVILNDNEMSISRNVGAIAKYLTHMRVSSGWLNIKQAISKSLLRIPHAGTFLFHIFQFAKNSIRNVFVRDRLFGVLGFRYLGPIDGHDIKDLERVFKHAKNMSEPVLIHISTRKGQGYALAEKKPESLHGTPPFYVGNGEPKAPSIMPSFGQAAGRYLCELANRRQDIVAVTAAMTESTGMSPYKCAFPSRFFDVGIAEEHAVVMAAGCARGGMRPFVAIYDTFLQRSYDQILEDVCMQKLPVCFLVDRAAIGGEDGPTHHGVFGISFLRHMPGIQLLSPRNCIELKEMMLYALEANLPVAIRYPRTESARQSSYLNHPFQIGKWECLETGDDCVLLGVSTMVSTALDVRTELAKAGISAGVYNASSVKPLDYDLLHLLDKKGVPYFTLEENVIGGGFGSAVLEYCVQNQISAPASLFALSDAFIPHGSRKTLLEDAALETVSISNKITRILKDNHDKTAR
jgi:1-deoxy-D-xylulose-5-phosphate synthase